MPVSSVSDFERFSVKVQKSISNKVKKIEEDSSSYAIKEEKKALLETKVWQQQVRSEWKHELNAMERQGQSDIADEVKQALSIFRKNHEMALKKALEERLEQSYPLLVECFISWVVKNYETGIFTLPKIYEQFIDKEKFDVHITEGKEVIFSNGNLYIEYSVKRIIEELNDDIIACIHSEENSWLK